MTPRPRFSELLNANASVLWTWVISVILIFGVQWNEELRSPSEGLALSSAALPALLVALTPPRLRRWSALGTLAGMALLAVANAVYHRVFSVYMPLSAFRSMGQAWTVRGYATGLLHAGDGWIPTLVALTVVGVALRSRGPRRPLELSRWWHTGLALSLCLVGSIPAVAWAWFVSPGSADTLTGGFAYAYLVDGRRILGEHLMAGGLTEAGWTRTLRSLRDRHPDPPPEDPWFGVGDGSNLVVIQVEALNGWLMDARVEGEPVVPFLRSLADRGLYFTNVFDETYLGRSSDADYLAMASQHPLERTTVSMGRPSLDPVALPDLLEERGYTTFSAHAHIPGFWNAALRHRAYGFQESWFEAELGPGDSLGFGLTDKAFLERITPHVVDLPQPWMAWFITLTMHGPHEDVPETFHTFPLGPMDGTPLGNYFLKARHTDDALRTFIGELERAGILENTTVVVYGDHTERHGFDMDWVHEAAGVTGLPPDVQHLLEDQVPLLVLPPGGIEGGGVRVATVGGLLDVAPTALSVLGIPTPPWFLGRSLTASEPGLAAQASGEVVGEDLMWTGTRCASFPEGTPRPLDACDDLRARARLELEVSWSITERGLTPRIRDALGDGEPPSGTQRPPADPRGIPGGGE